MLIFTALVVVMAGAGMVFTSFIKNVRDDASPVAMDVVWDYAGILRVGHITFFARGGYMIGK